MIIKCSLYWPQYCSKTFVTNPAFSHLVIVGFCCPIEGDISIVEVAMEQTWPRIEPSVAQWAHSLITALRS